ncbi:hypothetical protein [Mesorhizobium sp.]|uniref:hypothetical protein n=1 Tax=Mesorhizobium sp. TaxID=1871066 RepID=UPI00356A35AB
MPLRIAPGRLDVIPENYRAAYIEEEDPTKGFELSTCIADVIRDGETEIASLNAQIAKIQVEGPAKLAAVEQQIRDNAVDETLRLAFAKAGAHDGLVDGAMAILKKRNKFEAEKSSDDGAYAVLARNATWPLQVDSVVQQFMQSDEEAAYRRKSAAPPPEAISLGCSRA